MHIVEQLLYPNYGMIYVVYIDIRIVVVIKLRYVYLGDINATTGYLYKSEKRAENNS